jgi:CP family cyanate transporter-like MFS transporter
MLADALVAVRSDGGAHIIDPRVRSFGAVAIGAVFALSAGNAFALFSWLPTIAVEHGRLPAASAAVLLTVYSVMALPVALLVPWLTTRMSLLPLGLVGVACIVVGDVGFAFIHGPALFVVAVVAGAGQMLYPLCLSVLSARGATADTTRLSALGQGIGYAVGTVFPLLMSTLMATVDDWTVTLLGTAAVSATGVAAMMLLNFVFARPVTERQLPPAQRAVPQEAS